MINVTATGFIGEKPQLQVVGAISQKVEFDVIWNRRSLSGGEWKTIWERATFVAWGEEAEHIAESLDKGSNVSCTGLQETSEWVDRATGQKRSKVKFKLTAWIKHHNPRPAESNQQGHGDAQEGRPLDNNRHANNSGQGYQAPAQNQQHHVPQERQQQAPQPMRQPEVRGGYAPTAPSARPPPPPRGMDDDDFIMM